jgi:predicted transport protein
MAIFNIQNQKLLPIREKEIDLEKDIQKLTEENLEAVFGLQFVSSEFALQNFRIDTLAFDKEANSFVIIEYKRDRSFSVIDQGYAYLALMLNNKADFILEYNEKTKGNLKRENIDWSQSRVLFLAQSFTTYQQNAINFRDLPIELWEVKVFDNATILYNQLLSPEAKESIKTVTKNKTIENVSREVKVYTLEDHLNDTTEKIKTLFLALREKVLALDEKIEERPKKFYISYRTQVAFVYTHLQKEKIKIHLIISQAKLNDPKKISRDVSNVGHYGGGVTEIILDKAEDLPYVMTLIEQSFQVSKQ